MKLSGKKVFVTGADGFIGSHLVEALVNGNADVTALAMYNAFDRIGWLDDLPMEVRDSIRVVRGDVRDAHQMMTICRGQEVLFHLASLIAIPYSYDAPSSYVETNVQGAINVMSAALEANISKVVHTSTSEVYGTARFTPITEEHPLQGQSPYAASKIGADMIVESFAKSFGLPVSVLRPFNTYGPRQSERAIVSSLIRQSLDPKCDVLKVGNLGPKRDFTFVGDTVEAFISVAEHEGGYQIFNSGSGKMISIAELANLVAGVTGANKPIVVEKSRERPETSEVMVLIADYGQLLKSTGWKPRVSFEQGLEETVDWWRGHLPEARYDTGYMI